MSGSSIAAVNFLLYVTEALRRIVGANPRETSEDDVPALPPAPLVAEQEEVIDAPHVQWADEDEEEGGDDAGIGAFGMDDDEEEEEDGDDPNAEDGEAVLEQPELRRYNTMIVDFYEDEPSPINDEGIAFVDDANVEQNEPPLPIADVINGNPYVKIGNILIRAGNRKRDRSEFERDDGASSSSQSSDPDTRPLKRYRRKIRPIEQKRSQGRHVEIEDAMYESLEDDLERLQSQQEPSNIRLKFIGEDDLDDAPTPPGSPVAKIDFDFE